MPSTRAPRTGRIVFESSTAWGFKSLLVHWGRARLSLVDLEQRVLSDARLLEDCACGAFLERVPLWIGIVTGLRPGLVSTA
jgi:hypothetical protein